MREGVEEGTCSLLEKKNPLSWERGRGEGIILPFGPQKPII
jgi:hypothetical protein